MATRLVDKINENEVKIYYTGEVNTRLDDVLIESMKKVGFEFSGMAHQGNGTVHRLLFNQGWEDGS